MKKTAIILILLVTQLASCQIMPLSTLNAPNGAYLKDLDNTFLPYLGTWEGVLNNKKYTFEFVKFTQRLVMRSNSYSYYRDDLMGKFKVTDLITGSVIYDNLAITNYDQYRIDGTNPSTSRGICAFYFTDTDANCKNGMEFKLQNVTGQPNQLKYCYFLYTDSWTGSDCPYYPNRLAIPVFLPKEELILTK
ncbi:DUF6705 family protein, partial [Flavobacterium sp.]|uniref:DUF6705 family protein n=1 Tax=Flavobacterium sp. TaxID=239 RepID=UPI00374D7D71